MKILHFISNNKCFKDGVAYMKEKTKSEQDSWAIKVFGMPSFTQ
jgi:hypothetical protein